MVFTLEQDRVHNADVLLKAWCPRMDMLALVLGNGTLEVRRLSWQRLGDPIKIEGRVTSLVWKPDGKTIAVGYDDGRLQLLSVDRARSQELPGCHQAAITALCWVDAADQIDDYDPLDGSPVSIPRSSRVLHCFEPLLVLPKESGMNGTVKFAQSKIERPFDPDRLCILVSGDDRGAVKLHALGSFPVGQISVGESLSGSWFIPRSNRRSSVDFTIDEIDLSRDLHYLNAVVRLQNGRQPATLVQAIWDASILRSRHHEIRALSTQSANIEFLVDYVQNALRVGSRIWKPARKAFDMKFQSLETLFRDNVERQSITDALISLAVAGTLNQALMQFFSTCMPEQSVSRISKSWASSIDALLNLIDSNLRRALEELCFRLSELRALARCEGCEIGIRVSYLDSLLDSISSTLMKLEEMYRIVLDVRANFLHFFTWILDWVKNSCDESRSNLQPLVGTIDPEKVVEFIVKDLGADRIQKFFDCDPLDSNVTSHVPSDVLLPYSKTWTQHLHNSLQTEVSFFVEKWGDFRTTASDAISDSLTLCSALPLAYCDSKPPLSLCSRLHHPHHHCLAFLHAGHITVILSNHDNYQVGVFRLTSDVVQVGFHNDTHLAVLSRDSSTTHLSLVDVNGALQLCSVDFKGKDLGAQVLAEVLSPELSRVITSCRQRCWPHTQGSKIAVCGSRGMVSWLSETRRIVIVDVVNDEDDIRMVDA